MAFFDFWTESIAIDLGTANTLIIHNDKVVVDSPSIVAIDKKTERIIAVGKEASLMQGKTHENIKTVRPLKDGVKNLFFKDGMLLINRLIICYDALKSALTPSFNGRIVLIVSCVFPCIKFASFPTAIILPLTLFLATIDGLSITTFPLWIISVFAVPKSIAISSVIKSKKPI